MRIVGTSRMHTVVAAPKLKVDGSVVGTPGVVVDDDEGAVVGDTDDDVLVAGDVEGGVVVDVDVDDATVVVVATVAEVVGATVVVVAATVFGMQSSFGHLSSVVVVCSAVVRGIVDVVGCSHGPSV